MKSPTKHFWLVSSALVALCAIAGTSFAQSSERLGQRTTGIEHKLDTPALARMVNQLAILREQVRNLRGDIQEIRHQLQELQARQRDIYSNLDRRLRKLEQGGTAPQDSSDSSSNTASQTPFSSSSKLPKIGSNAAVQNISSISPSKAYAAYEQAFNVLKEGRYARSRQEFREFLRRYPNSQYADNARYWLGESYYAERLFNQALEQFRKVLANFPNGNKRAAARLKIGFIQYEQGKLEQARETLVKVIQRHPNSAVASLAKQRLRLIDSSQQ